MVMRNIVKIDEQKCNGCGLCINACAEGAIELIDGKARLISETYCDGLGACLGHCPEGAITIEQREAEDFDEAATQTHLARQRQGHEPPAGCPGIAAQQLTQEPESAGSAPTTAQSSGSQLSHWPVQLSLVPPSAKCFENADVLLVADCVAFAMADFHDRFLQGHSLVVGCPKLDNVEFYIDKLTAILKANTLKSLTVVHMEVPCCSGLTHIARQAITRAQVELPFDDVTIGLKGNVLKTDRIETAKHL